MDLKKLAEEALTSIDKKGIQIREGIAQCAIIGFLQGVRDGDIQVGQSWFAKLLVEQVAFTSDTTLLKQLFASKIGCEGQILGRAPTHAARHT